MRPAFSRDVYVQQTIAQYRWEEWYMILYLEVWEVSEFR